MTRSTILSLIAFSLFLSPTSRATDRFYSDREAKSDSGQYTVTATSPDNQPNGKKQAFQRAFTYICKDTRSGKTLWTRNQAMGEPPQSGDDPSNTDRPQEEGSPSRIFISDTGYTVIYTGWQELIVVDLAGKDTGKIDVLGDGFTKEENKKYVSNTTAGPMWASRSHWYFIESEAVGYFVIRPWWGRHLIVELASGSIKKPTDTLQRAIAEAEKSYVLSVMQGVLDGTIEKCDCCGGPHEAVFAAYLAGVLKIKDAVPALRKLEDDTSIGSSTLGGFDEVPQGRIDPFNYSTYTTRQTIHLALRRLGEKPGSFPCTRFKTEHKDYDQMKPYVRKPVEGSRETNASKVQNDLSPEQVIGLLDCPDYVVSRIWQYDIDAQEPYTLAVSWTNDQKVRKIEVIRPALWQEGTIRDRD